MFDDIFSTLDDWLSPEYDAAGEDQTVETLPEWDLVPVEEKSDWDYSLQRETPAGDETAEGYEADPDVSNLGFLWDTGWEYAPDACWEPDRFEGWGNPIEDADCWQLQDGQNSCAVVAQIGVYESITGEDISEAEACQIAEENGWFDPEIGTYPENVGKLLEALGIPTEQRYEANLEDIATALERGDKVIVALDANEIWTPIRDPATGSPVEQSNGGHAVWVTGIDQQPDGSVQIILNDSGTPDGRMKAVDAADFLNAWQDYGNLLVVADAPDQPVWA